MRRSQAARAGIMEIFSIRARRHPLGLIRRTILAAASTLVLLFPTFAVGQDKVQGATPPAESDEELRDRVKSLERTVEELKKDRGSPKVGESNVKPEYVYKVPTLGTSTEVLEHERERGMLRQDKVASWMDHWHLTTPSARKQP